MSEALVAVDPGSVLTRLAPGAWLGKDMLIVVEAAGLAVAVVVGVGGAIFAYLQWRDRRPRARLEYVVLTRTTLIPQRWSGAVQLVHDGDPVEDPALVIFRMVHAGDAAIEAGDFETDLRLTLVDSGSVASVNQTGQRPADFAPDLRNENNSIFLGKTLINPGDMIELQVLVSGLPKRIDLEGRVSDVTFRRLPLAPRGAGSGPGGSFEKSDWVLYGLIFPVMALGLAYAAAASETTATALRIVLPIVIVILLVASLLRMAWNVKRGAMWIPERSADASGTTEQPRNTSAGRS